MKTGEGPRSDPEGIRDVHPPPLLQDAEEDLLLADIAEPCSDIGIGSLGLAQLGDDVGIEQVTQCSTGRPRSSGRSKSPSSPTSGISRRSSLRDLAGR